MVLIFGKTGSGKSYLAKRILEPETRLIVFDPKEEYSGLVVETFGEFLYYFEDEPRENFRIVCRFRDAEDYDRAATACFALKNLTLVLEECELFLSSYDLNSTLPINQIISHGRHDRISVVAIGRRPSEIPVRIRAQCTSIVTFKQTEPRDLQFLQSWGFDIEEVERLVFEEHKYLVEGEPVE